VGHASRKFKREVPISLFSCSTQKGRKKELFLSIRLEWKASNYRDRQATTRRSVRENIPLVNAMQDATQYAPTFSCSNNRQRQTSNYAQHTKNEVNLLSDNNDLLLQHPATVFPQPARSTLRTEVCCRVQYIRDDNSQRGENLTLIFSYTGIRQALPVHNTTQHTQQQKSTTQRIPTR
jgi:hypothetical protein